MRLDSVIIRYDEIGLKSAPVRRQFAKILIRNIKQKLGKNVKVYYLHSRLLIKVKDAVSAARKIRTVFGISSVSPALEADNDLGNIKSKSLLFYNNGSFRISCQRVDKDFRMTSSEVCREVGAFIAGKTGAKVDLENYDLNISVELFNNKAYLFSEKLKGFGGLPAGSEGKVLCIINNEIGLLSALMMMNRGCHPLITGSKEWFKELVKFAPHLGLKFYKDYSLIIRDCGAVVKSGRLDAHLFRKDKEMFALPVLYPLIGLDKKGVKGKYFSAMSG